MNERCEDKDHQLKLKLDVSNIGTYTFYIWAEAYGKFKVLSKPINVKVVSVCSKFTKENLIAPTKTVFEVSSCPTSTKTHSLEVNGFKSNKYECTEIDRYYASSSTKSHLNSMTTISNPSDSCSLNSDKCKIFQVDISKEGTFKFYLWVQAYTKFSYVSSSVKVVNGCTAMNYVIPSKIFQIKWT